LKINASTEQTAVNDSMAYLNAMITSLLCNKEITIKLLMANFAERGTDIKKCVETETPIRSLRVKICH